MIKALRFMAFCAVLCWSNGSFADNEFVPGEFVIRNSNKILEARTVDAAEEASGKNLAVTDVTDAGIKIQTDVAYAGRGRDVDICGRLRDKEREKIRRGAFVRPLAKHCERNYKLKAVATTPNDSYYSSMWGLQRLRMPEVWDRSKGSSNIVVAVIDTGLNYSHPDLQGNIWVNPYEVPGNGIDDDGNGYVDDTYGANFITGTGDPLDDNGHGTHVAGTIGAKTNNGTGVAGLNWNVKIMALKFLGSNGSGTLWGAVNALAYARAMKERGVNIVLSNNSWGGGGFYSTLYDEIKRARDAGMLFVAAAGNSSINSDVNPQYPASYDVENIVSVAAIDSNGVLASFSNYGATTVDIGAPGVDIASTWSNGGYVYLSGTSMACPHVSGALALMKAYSSGLDYTQLKQALLSSALPNANLAGKIATGGELNLMGALNSIPYNPDVPGTPTPSPTPTLTPTNTPTATVTPPPYTPTPTATPAPGRWTVRVIGETGTGLAQVTVTVTGPAGFSASGSTGTDGSLLLQNLAGGAYSAVFAKSGYTISALQFTVDGDTVSTVSAAKSTYAISGLIVDKMTASPIAGVNVDIFVNGTLSGSTSSGANGTFAVNIPFGDSYRLEIRNNRYYPQDMTGTVRGRALRVSALMPR